MDTITLPKIKYIDMRNSQRKLTQKVNLIEKILLDLTQDDVRSEYADKLNKISSDMDKGKGIKFVNADEAEKYLN